MAGIYDVNGNVIVDWTFEDQNGAPATPSNVWLKWVDPSTGLTGEKAWVAPGPGADPDIVLDAVGVFHATIVATSPGAWHYRAIGQGGINDEKEGFFVVKIPRVPPGP